MAEQQSPLMAFRVAETLVPFERPGHYDADTQVWVGDTVGAQGSGGGSTESTSTTYYTGGAGGQDTEPDSDDVTD